MDSVLLQAAIRLTPIKSELWNNLEYIAVYFTLGFILDWQVIAGSEKKNNNQLVLSCHQEIVESKLLSLSFDKFLPRILVFFVAVLGI